MTEEPAIIVAVWGLLVVASAALAAKGYVSAIVLATVLYIVGKIVLDIAGFNPGGLAEGYAFEAPWFGHLIGQLIPVWLLTALFFWLVNRERRRAG